MKPQNVLGGHFNIQQDKRFIECVKNYASEVVLTKRTLSNLRAVLIQIFLFGLKKKHCRAVNLFRDLRIQRRIDNARNRKRRSLGAGKEDDMGESDEDDDEDDDDDYEEHSGDVEEAERDAREDQMDPDEEMQEQEEEEEDGEVFTNHKKV